MLSYKLFSNYGRLENTEVTHFKDVLDSDIEPHLWPWTLGSDVMECKITLHGTFGLRINAF